MAEKKINTDHDHLGVSRIRNLPDGVDPGDAVSLSQMEAAIAAETEDGPEPLLAAVEDLEEAVETLALRSPGAMTYELTASQNIAANGTLILDFPVPDLNVGDVLAVSPPAAFPASLTLRGVVVGPGQGRIQVYNPTGNIVTTGIGFFAWAAILKEQ